VNFTDRTLNCRECGMDFIFTAGEQAFFAEKGLLNEPQRCPACRAARRRERSGGVVREMHPVVCAQCGTNTTVPFLPRLDRPVYCSSCFEQVRTRP
jgi:CxxC-x17-CxxC domain-containing protein